MSPHYFAFGRAVRAPPCAEAVGVPPGPAPIPAPRRVGIGRWVPPLSSPTNVHSSPPIPLSQQLKASQQEEAGKDATKISVSSNRGSYEVCAWEHRCPASPNPGTHCRAWGAAPHGGSFCPHCLSLSAGPSSATLGVIRLCAPRAAEAGPAGVLVWERGVCGVCPACPACRAVMCFS